MKPNKGKINDKEVEREIIEVKATIINRLTVALEYLDEFLIEDVTN